MPYNFAANDFYFSHKVTWWQTFVKQSAILNGNQCKKTYQFKTQCKGDINHAFETAKITVFDPVVCKTPDAPLQNELLC